jgi:hypothetical protein
MHPNVSLKHIILYVWQEMPVMGWAVFITGMLVIIGLAIYLDGKLTMRYSSFTRESISMDENGLERKIVTSGFTSDYDDGEKTARLGLLMAMSSLVALIGFVRAY